MPLGNLRESISGFVLFFAMNEDLYMAQALYWIDTDQF
jgi:hypothetical protein